MLIAKLALAACAAAVAYLLGCANGAITTSRLIFHDDIRSHGSGNAGLTNFCRSFGWKYAPLVILIDVLKTVLAILLGSFIFGRYLSDPVTGKMLAALFCVIGHLFPVFEGFHGGKGILCGGVLLIMLDWRVALIGWGLFIALVAATRYVSLGSVAAAASLPLSTVFLLHAPPAAELFSVITAALILRAHRENISRLIKGTENKISFHK